MPRMCQICKKKPKMSMKRKLLRGHYNPTAKKIKYPNLQWAILDSGKRAKVCTTCIRTMHKIRS